MGSLKEFILGSKEPLFLDPHILTYILTLNLIRLSDLVRLSGRLVSKTRKKKRVGGTEQPQAQRSKKVDSVKRG